MANASPNISNMAIEKLGLKAIILHEKASGDKTVIEKFEKYSDVGFALVLLSPDDEGAEYGSMKEDFQPRARQNVIFEFGFFIAKLGRAKVIVLVKELDGEEIERPSDLTGIIYEPYDKLGAWRLNVVRELRTNGYSVTADSLID